MHTIFGNIATAARYSGAMVLCGVCMCLCRFPPGMQVFFLSMATQNFPFGFSLAIDWCPAVRCFRLAAWRLLLEVNWDWLQFPIDSD